MTRRTFQFGKRRCAAMAAAAAACAGLLPGAAAQSAIAAAPAAAVTMSPGVTARPMGDSMHLVVGRSIFINTISRLRRVYVSNPAVLDSFTASPRQIVVTAKNPGVSSLVLWDESGQSQSYLINSDLDVGSLRSVIHDALPSESIRVEGDRDQVDLSGTVSNQAAAEQAVKLAALFSKSVADSLLVAPRHTPQVSLKVRFVEIDRSRAEQLGFNFFGSGKNSFNASTGQFPAITVAPSAASGTSSSNGTVSSLLGLQNLLSLFYYNNTLGVGAAIQALENKQILQILAEPTITAISGEKASFLSGGEFPFPVVQGGTGGFTSVTIQFRPYGVKLDFTPTVMADGTIHLKIAPEVSALDYTNQVTISGYTVPAISTRRADTQIELRSGQSFALSGLLDNRTTDLLEKIPGIGQVPVLGKLFQTRSQNHSVEELAVIVTPTIIDPLSETAQPTTPKMVIPFISDPKFDKGIAPKKQPQTETQGVGHP
jgi:pilus assembly protein CpaC